MLKTLFCFVCKWERKERSFVSQQIACEIQSLYRYAATHKIGQSFDGQQAQYPDEKF